MGHTHTHTRTHTHSQQCVDMATTSSEREVNGMMNISVVTQRIPGKSTPSAAISSESGQAIFLANCSDDSRDFVRRSWVNDD